METPIQQSVSELSLHLYQRALHPELFNIYSSRQFFQGDYEVLIWVLGCSHAISVFHGRECMTEVICSPQQLLPKRGFVGRMAFRGEKSHQCRWGSRFAYRVSLQVEQMSPNLFRNTHSELANVGSKRGIFVNFPQWARGELEPFSYLDYEAHAEELHVQTYHAFPEHQTILKTQSLFSLGKR